jgi:ribosome biogenesis protein Tsr3
MIFFNKFETFWKRRISPLLFAPNPKRFGKQESFFSIILHQIRNVLVQRRTAHLLLVVNLERLEGRKIPPLLTSNPKRFGNKIGGDQYGLSSN